MASYDAHLAAPGIRVTGLKASAPSVTVNAELRYTSRSRIENYPFVGSANAGTLVSQADRIDVIEGNVIEQPYTEIRCSIGKPG